MLAEQLGITLPSPQSADPKEAPEPEEEEDDEEEEDETKAMRPRVTLSHN